MEHFINSLLGSEMLWCCLPHFPKMYFQKSGWWTVRLN